MMFLLEECFERSAKVEFGKRTFLLMIVAALYSSSSVAATQFYISPTGNDTTGQGTSASPWQTLEKARDHIAGISNFNDDMEVILKDGTYRLSSTFDLGAAHSGKNGYTITYKAENAGQAVISGGQLITGWSDSNSDGIWQASVPAGSDSRQLYVDGSRAVRARSTNGSGWSENSSGYSTPSGVSNWSNKDDIELVFEFRWKQNRGQVVSVSGNQATLETDFMAASGLEPFGRPSQTNGPSWVENNLALLDANGEWYLDRTANQLYYKPLNGQSLPGGGSGGSSNVATSGTVTQSSTAWGGVASRAIDGNTNGVWSNNSVSHTDLGNESYLTLDLGSVKNIDNIKVWNRTDCCSDRLSNFHVFVSDTSFTGTTVAASQGQSGVFDHRAAGIAPTTTDIAVNRTGRYIRVQLEAANQVLSLAELEVFSPDGGGSGSSSVSIVLPQLEALVFGDGVENIRFEGLVFSEATWLFPNGPMGYTAMQAGVTLRDRNYITLEGAFEGAEATPGNVQFNNSKNIVFSGNTFRNLGGAGLGLGIGTQDSTVYDNTFDGISASSIVIGSPQAHHPVGDSTKNILVDNNLVRNIALEYRDNPAITSLWADGSVIVNNTIENVPYSGISTGWGWGRYDVDQIEFTTDNTGKAYNTPTVLKDTLVLQNKIDGLMQVLHDGGGVYNLSANPNSRFTGNVITRGGNLNGAIYLDNGSRAMQVNNNVSYNNTGPRVNDHIKQAQTHIVQNNDWSGGSSTFNSSYQSVVNASGRKLSPVERTIATIRAGLPTPLALPAGAIPPSSGLALNKPASASLNNGNAGNAVDGKPDTAWEAGSGQTSGWWQIDMGSNSIIERVNMAWGKIVGGELEYIRNNIEFQILTSTDGVNFTTRSFFTPGGVGLSIVPAGTTTLNINQAINDLHITNSPTARYVRLNVVNSNGQDFGLARVKIIGSEGALSGTNIATSGTATQSSTPSSGAAAAGVASRAIDGNTDGVFNNNSVTHTNDENEAYWTLDLGSVKQIDGISIWNRTDCCSERLSNFHVFISDTPFTGTTVAASRAQAGVFDHFQAGAANTVTNVVTNRTGRYVRIQLTSGSNPLSLAEVQVFGEDTGGGSTNVATLGTVTQSSTDWGGVAGRAIDGNTSGIWGNNSVTHTDLGSESYLTIDLGSIRNIDNIKVWNRTDCCSDRLSNFHVFVSDSPFTGTTVAASQGQSGVFDHRAAGVAPATTDITVNRTGRYVRVQLEATNQVLSLAEVEVFGN